MTQLQTIDLEHVQGGSWASSFVRGFIGGTIHGPTAKTEQIDVYGDRHWTGFKPGVEVGMMFNMALGPIGRLFSTAGKALPPPKQA